MAPNGRSMTANVVRSMVSRVALPKQRRARSVTASPRGRFRSSSVAIERGERASWSRSSRRNETSSLASATVRLREIVNRQRRPDGGGFRVRVAGGGKERRLRTSHRSDPQLGDEIVARAEVMIKRPHGRPALRRDRGHGSILHSVLEHQGSCRIENRILGMEGFRRHGSRSDSGRAAAPTGRVRTNALFTRMIALLSQVAVTGADEAPSTGQHCVAQDFFALFSTLSRRFRRRRASLLAFGSSGTDRRSTQTRVRPIPLIRTPFNSRSVKAGSACEARPDFI